ncbi:MAG: hybrid sensor histidine kinase/response regulator [Pseudanabaenales cyanobacterium]|nr:hybrid sensor histidine kinase/response regulator [Pseudanabaenales cyanobacterium]
MNSDPSITQQAPSYFLQEASELLQQIDKELQSLRQDFSVQKMHSLMRVAHTLKGAAASVGLDAIKTTTHSLEDAFKALCVPDAVLTPVVEGLIFEAYDCLQLLLSVQIAEAQIDESSILDRMANVVAGLQDNLGDQFGQDGYLPTSTELGFDMTQSIFEMGVTQRLEELENALKAPESDTLNSLLRSQAKVFFGLSESLNLPGFGEIAQATLTALNNSPNQVVQIATVALKDYRSGQASVLQGDRTQGGSPSSALKQLGKKQAPKKASKHPKTKVQKSQLQKSKSGWFGRFWQRLNQPSGKSQPSKARTSSISKPSLKKTSDPETPSDLAEPVSNTKSHTAIAQTAESIWETATVSSLPEVIAAAADEHSPSSAEKTPYHSQRMTYLKAADEHSPSSAEKTAQTLSLSLPSTSINQEGASTESLSSTPSRDDTLRVSIDHLEQLNHIIGELLTQQNRQALQNERLTTTMKTLLARLGQQQRQLYKLQRQTIQTSADFHLMPFTPIDQQFDSLELDHYSELQLLVQASLETMIQQMESAEAVELFVRQSGQTLEKQQRLMHSLREIMIEVRMQPIGNLLQRFHQVLTRLSTQHSKPVTLIVQGSDVLVDKAIIDKLYDPLLHLVRNAFDHGIERPEVRKQQGKDEKGQIQLSASQEGRYLVIKIQDNGQGLNLNAIRQKAIENQLITTEEAQKLTAAQISDFIFEPDLSTAAQVNELSGRGVGLHAVGAQMQKLRGEVTVTHQSGRGTCFTLKIPANLTIAKLLLCQAGEKLYALMTDSIEQILIPRSGQLKSRDKRKILSLQVEAKEQLIPVVPLSESLAYNASLPDIHWRATNKTSDTPCPIILMQYKNRLVGLEIEQLIGEQELVIRSLGDISAIPTYIYGCSILPDGRLSLVVDGTALALKTIKALSRHASKTANDNDLQVSPSKSPLVSTPKQSILVVDDSTTVRNTLTQTLKKAGYSVLQAKDGTEAFQKLQQVDVSAILCDLEMPGMNGFEFLKVRQQTPKTASIPTIMLTSRTGAKHRQLAQALGANDYLTKPYLAPQLLAKLTGILTQPSEVNLLDMSEDIHG